MRIKEVKERIGGVMMSIGEIGQIVSACIISAGGVGGIILAVVKFSCNSIAERLSKKYELKLSKEMERYKAGIENKVYIAKQSLIQNLNFTGNYLKHLQQWLKKQYNCFLH